MNNKIILNNIKNIEQCTNEMEISLGRKDYHLFEIKLNEFFKKYSEFNNIKKTVEDKKIKISKDIIDNFNNFKERTLKKINIIFNFLKENRSRILESKKELKLRSKILSAYSNPINSKPVFINHKVSY